MLSSQLRERRQVLNKTESTVFIKTLQGKANEDDFTELDITPVTFSAKEDIKTVSVKT